MPIVYVVIREAHQMWPAQVLGVVDQAHLSEALAALAKKARAAKRLPTGARLKWDEEHKPGVGAIYHLKKRRWGRHGETVGYRVEPLEINALTDDGLFERHRVELR